MVPLRSHFSPMFLCRGRGGAVLTLRIVFSNHCAHHRASRDELKKLAVLDDSGDAQAMYGSRHGVSAGKPGVAGPCNGKGMAGKGPPMRAIRPRWIAWARCIPMPMELSRSITLQHSNGTNGRPLPGVGRIMHLAYSYELGQGNRKRCENVARGFIHTPLT